MYRLFLNTVFENHRKSLIQQVYILSGQKFIKNAKKLSVLESFWKPQVCGQIGLPENFNSTKVH